MILLGYNWLDVVFGILYTSLGLLVIVILYRKLLRYLGRNEPTKADYCVLYTLEENPSKGEVTFYFTADTEKEYKLYITAEDGTLAHAVREGKCTAGGNIVRYDSTGIANGNYYFVLETDNQKTAKKMTVENG